MSLDLEVWGIFIRASLIWLLLASLIVSGCASPPLPTPSSHASTVERPALDSDDLGAWRLYYEDQIRVAGEHVAEPTDSYPINAREAYRLEMQQWAVRQTAAENRRLEEPVYGFLGVVLLGLVGYGAYALVAGD